MKKSKYIISLLLSFTIITKAQTPKIDSLYNELNLSKHDTSKAALYVALSDAFYEFNKDSTSIFFTLCQKAIKIVDKKLKNCSDKEKKILEIIKSDALQNIGVKSIEQGDFDGAIKYFNESLALRQKNKNITKEIETYHIFAILYYMIGELDVMLNYAAKALDLSNKIGDKQLMAESYHIMGMFQINISNGEKALELWNKALEIYKVLGDKNKEASTLHDIGFYYRNTNKLDTAEIFWRKSLKIHEEIGDKSGIAGSKATIAFLLHKRGKHDEALELFKQILKLSIENHDVSSSDYSNVGNMYYYKKEYNKALEYNLKAYNLAQEKGQYEYISATAEDLIKVYEKMGNYKRAIEYYKVFIENDKKIKIEDGKKKEIEYSYQRKAVVDSVAFEKEKEIREVEIAKQKIELKAKQNQQYVLYGGLILVLAFAGFMYNRFNVTQKQKVIIEKQKELVEEKQKEIIASIRYAKRIQDALMTSQKYIERNMNRLKSTK